ncbi:transforming growth factor beta receptor type 3 [Archocentrus centrarchus]|uniref:transforming growth factor beta receptor type 3 n=1 Tax=Archocentrus centrarchus TaxID=63155 RepID=UPI0011E9CC44|nr:transforming growth factor beta receptor type 3-like [Archocentrus centrarchus]
MMPSLSGVRWTFFFLSLLWESPEAQSGEVQCSVAGPVGPQHPVQGLLERFEAGPGCAARERGNKETHVIALRRVTNSPENKVTVLMKPLSLSPSPLRVVHLVLISKVPVIWWLDAERLPTNLPVLVQVSSNASVQSSTLRLHVQTMHSLPFRPRALHRWALKHHGNLSSLTHSSHGNRVYLRLGEDPTLPPVCQLQSMFISRNYMTSDLQPQEVQGCTHTQAGGASPEVHVIKLHSPGSGLCGSMQVEVSVSLVPPVTNSRGHKVVLILSSSVPVNWAIAAHGVQGHISVHSSNSVSPPYPPEPGLTVASTLDPDLSSISDLLLWASESGFTKVTSYTEADLANHFVIQLAEGGADKFAVMNPLVARPPKEEEHRLRQWLNGGGRAGGGQQGFTVNCEGGRLSVMLDKSILQSLSVPVAALTLRDLTCQAESNGSHFLLVFPVISCGTEGLLLGEPRGVQYKNTVLIWSDKPQTILSLNGTEKSKGPLGIRFSCFSAVPGHPSGAAGNDNVNTTQTELIPWVPEGPWPNTGLSHFPAPRHRSGPVLLLQLFVTDSYEQRRIGPCVITADQRVYVQISAQAPLADVVEVKSCVVSSFSDPKKSPFWTVISNGCSSDPSLTLSAKTKHEQAEAEDNGKLEEEMEEMEGLGNSRIYQIGEKRESGRRTDKKTMSTSAEAEIQPLRFSFILRPVYNDSMQFLHCSLRLCVSDSTRGEPMKETVKNDCQGRQRMPLLLYRSPRHQCEIRNLSRPMVVTHPISSLSPKMRTPTGQRIKRLSVTPLARPEPERSGSVVEAGPVMGIVFAAFVMGVALMGGLWCIYNYTERSAYYRGHLTDQTHGEHSIWNPPSVSDQSSSSV